MQTTNQNVSGMLIIIMLAVLTKELWHWRSNWSVCRQNLRILSIEDSCLHSL